MQVGRLIGFGLEGALSLGTYPRSCPETCRVLDADLSISSDISYIEPLYRRLPIVSVSTYESCVLARVFYWNVYLRKETTGCGKPRRERENKGLLPWEKARLHFSHKSNERVKERKASLTTPTTISSLVAPSTGLPTTYLLYTTPGPSLLPNMS